jgi:hypothetical protein
MQALRDYGQGRKPASDQRRDEGTDTAIALHQMSYLICYCVQADSRVVGMPAMMYINRREFGNTTNEKPFNSSQTGKTMIKYGNVWQQIIAYIWRTHELRVVQPRVDQPVEDRRPPYHITGQQYRCMERIKAIVGRDVEENWFEDMGSDSGSNDERLDEQQEEELQGRVLAFMLVLLDHVLSDDEYASALISGMAVLGISTDSGWLSPLVYTPKQSAMVSTSRMLVLYQSTKMRQQEVEKWKAQGFGAEDAAAMALGHHTFVQEMSHRFMTLAEYGGKPTPMDAILRLRAFGFKIRFTSNAEGVIDWIGSCHCKLSRWPNRTGHDLGARGIDLGQK